jgi:hypothetical protein
MWCISVTNMCWLILKKHCPKLGWSNMGLIGNKEYGLFYLLELSMYLLPKYSCHTHEICMLDIAPCSQTDQMSHIICSSVQTLTGLWMVHSFFWVIPQCLNFVPMFWNTVFIGCVKKKKHRHITFRCRGITQKKEYIIICYFKWLQGQASEYMTEYNFS